MFLKESHIAGSGFPQRTIGFICVCTILVTMLLACTTESPQGTGDENGEDDDNNSGDSDSDADSDGDGDADSDGDGDADSDGDSDYTAGHCIGGIEVARTQCVDYTGSNWQPDTIQTMCEDQLRGEYGEGHCSELDLVGRCFVTKGEPREIVFYYYTEDFTVAEAETHCNDNFGEFE